MKKAEFYAMHQYKGMVGVIKRAGIKFEIEGITLYAYECDEIPGRIHIIDPNTGMSIIEKSKRFYPDLIADCITNEEIEKIRALSENSKCQKLEKVFKLYKKAAIEYERYVLFEELERQQA